MLIFYALLEMVAAPGKPYAITFLYLANCSEMLIKSCAELTNNCA